MLFSISDAPDKYNLLLCLSAPRLSKSNGNLVLTRFLMMQYVTVQYMVIRTHPPGSLDLFAQVSAQVFMQNMLLR